MNIIHKTSDHTIVLLDVKRYNKPRLRKVPKKINWSMSKFEMIFNPSKDEVLKANADKFVKWVIKQLKDTGQTVKVGQNYNACALYLNEKNLQKLNERLDPMTWLNYSPTTSEGLPDNKLGIDLQEVVVKV